MSGSPTDDLTEETLRAVLPERPLRVYPALVSTEADALSWAHAGAPEGAVVVAEYQVAPRNRAGFLWEVPEGSGVGLSLVLRPELTVHREGWLFAVATAAMVEVAGESATIVWPDEVRVAGRLWGAATVRTESDDHDIDVAIVSIVLVDVRRPRTEVIQRMVTALERQLEAGEEETRQLVVDRCQTIGRSVTARLVPLGPTAQEVSGLAVDVKLDGALVLRTRQERRMAVRPHAVGVLEESL